MATLVLTTVGNLVGGPIGGAIGAVVGQSLDAALFAPKAREGPRLGDLAVQVSSYGLAIAKLFGTLRVAGTVIWSTDLIERRATSGGGKGRAKTVDYSYSASFAVALSGRPVIGVKRIWADGKLLRGAAGDFKTPTLFRLHKGEEDQAADPLIVAAEGEAPAFRGVAYAMFEDFQLSDYGNRIPSLTFEVEADAGAVTVSGVAAGLTSGAVQAGVSPELGGFAATGGSIRGTIEGLADLAGLALADDGSGLLLGQAVTPATALTREEELPRRAVVRRAAASVPGEVSLAYHDLARDYQTGLQRARADGAPAEQRAERRAVAAALSADRAKALAERRLSALWAARVTANVSLGWRAATLRPGMLVTLDGEGGRWRIARTVIGAMTVRLELVRVAAGSLAAVAAEPGRPVSEADRPHGPTMLRLLDLPLGEARERPFVAALAAGSEPGWRRAQLSISRDGGASWSDIGPSAAPAILGMAATALGPGDTALFDSVASVEVDLLHDEMELLSRDQDALVGGANLALIGEELIQFGQAERIGPVRWRLSQLLRGRRGTEHACAGHAAGEDFALLEAESLATVDPSDGLVVGASVQLLGSGVGDSVPAEADLIVTGETLRPPSPQHVAAEEQADGGLMIRWVRRSRLGWSWTSGSDTPIGEESERYRLTLTGAGFLRSVEVGASAWLYTAAERASDGASVTVDIVQVGTRAASLPATIMV